MAIICVSVVLWAVKNQKISSLIVARNEIAKASCGNPLEQFDIFFSQLQGKMKLISLRSQESNMYNQSCRTIITSSVKLSGYHFSLNDEGE